jgi:hypothetical protein
LNKDLENDLALRLDFGGARSAAVQIETLHAPSVESREAHITRPANSGQLKNGKVTVAVPRASALRVTVI